MKVAPAVGIVIVKFGDCKVSPFVFDDTAKIQSGENVISYYNNSSCKYYILEKNESLPPNNFDNLI